MNLTDLIEDAKSRVAESSSNFFTDEMWTRWLNQGQRVIVRQTKVLQSIATTSTVAGQRSYPMAEDFWQPKLVKCGTVVLLPMSVEDLEEQIISSGTPSHFCVWNRSILLWPTPVAVQTLKVYYYEWPDTLSSDNPDPEIPEPFHELISTYAAYKARMADEKPALADRLFAEFQNGVREMMEAYAVEHASITTVRDVGGW